MPTGSGAIVVHRMLEQQLDDYDVVPYSPALTYFPPALRWCVPRPDADVIHTTPDHAAFFRREGVPLVTTFHNLVIDRFMLPYSTFTQRLHYQTDLRFFLRRAVQMSDQITTVSQFTADLIRRELNCDRPIAVIPNGIDTEFFHPPSKTRTDTRLKVLFSGKPSLRKGAQWLPEIARKLKQSVRVICAGGLHGRWAKALDAAGVEVLGPVPYRGMPELYRSVDMLLLPTVREGDCLAVLEAMSSGIPIVASNCSSLPERVVHGQGGFLCEIGDINQFVAATERLLDSQLRRRMGEFNRNRAEAEFGLRRTSARYANLFAAHLGN